MLVKYNYLSTINNLNIQKSKLHLVYSIVKNFLKYLYTSSYHLVNLILYRNALLQLLLITGVY